MLRGCNSRHEYTKGARRGAAISSGAPHRGSTWCGLAVSLAWMRRNVEALRSWSDKHALPILWRRRVPRFDPLRCETPLHEERRRRIRFFQVDGRTVMFGSGVFGYWRHRRTDRWNTADLGTKFLNSTRRKQLTGMERVRRMSSE